MLGANNIGLVAGADYERAKKVWTMCCNRAKRREKLSAAALLDTLRRFTSMASQRDTFCGGIDRYTFLGRTHHVFIFENVMVLFTYDTMFWAVL